MANQMNCNSCNELRTSAPDFMLNGLTDTQCNYLKNNTGVSGSSDNCTDLNNMNDCFVGGMVDEVDAYDTCDWKEFMKKFIPNVWTVLKGIICALCGIWSRIDKLDCEVDYLFKGTTFSVSEESNTKSFVVAGKGVSFLERSSDGHSSDVNIVYIAGGLCRVGGSLRFHTADFNEPGTAKCYNFDLNGTTYRQTNARKGNAYWDDTGNIDSELVYEIRISKAEYPQIRSMFSGIGQEAEGGGFHIDVRVFNAGQYAYGQHGSCSTENGNPTQTGYDSGHLVPDNYIFVQVRMSYIFSLVTSGTSANVTPRGLLGMRTSHDAIEC